MREVVIASAVRTPIGSFQGAFSTVSAAELGTIVIKEALNRAGIKPEDVDDTYLGCVLQAGQYQGIYSRLPCYAQIQACLKYAS